MAEEIRSEYVFVTELDKLFFEIGQKLAQYKTPEEQKRFLKGLLGKLHDLQSSYNETEETKLHVTNHYKKGFVRWALEQNDLITSDSMKKNGGTLFWHDEKKQARKFQLPHHLQTEFQQGWDSTYKK